jgi:hypothetical protein
LLAQFGSWSLFADGWMRQSALEKDNQPTGTGQRSIMDAHVNTIYDGFAKHERFVLDTCDTHLVPHLVLIFVRPPLRGSRDDRVNLRTRLARGQLRVSRFRTLLQWLEQRHALALGLGDP